MKKKIKFIFVFLLLLFGGYFTTMQTNAADVMKNDVIYFVDTKDWGEIYLYLFDPNGTYSEPWSWQNEKGVMVDTGIDVDGHNLYSYTLTDNNLSGKYWKLVFSSKASGKQTKDLTYIKKDILFAPYQDPQDDGKYDGEWYIKDKSELNNLVKQAQAINQEQYTTASYKSLSTALTDGTKVLNELYTLVDLDGNSVYYSTVTNLDNALKALKLKNKITVTNTTGGTINLDSLYFEDNETINFNITPEDGYKVKEVIVSNNTTSTPLTITDDNKYSYTATNNDITISANYELKTYTITIDNNEYKLTHGSKITDISNYQDLINKDNHTFKGFKNTENNTEFNPDTEITNDLKLITEFEENTPSVDNDTTEDNESNDSKDTNEDKNIPTSSNPKTGDKIIISFVGLLFAGLGIITATKMKKKTSN